MPQSEESDNWPADKLLFVPPDISELHNQAIKISGHSPRAAVTLCRCCLELLLSNMGYQGSLSQRIDQAMIESSPAKSLSISLRRSLDVIRYLGNNAAHPIYDGSPKKLVTIDDEEAEWCIEIIERILDEYYEQPEYTETRMMVYEGNLRAMGRARTLVGRTR